ncbi:NAD(P)-binding domain-containing protein [Nocardia sp. CDC153]|uniref:NADPH-dependent F420 reductase n=1 Tax=Nocardia sp. CDC153 TaxID=3112167 RepID=UPI002DBE82C9|nr:NAD(P)-binding domain-containing protein [Nocardia sp. CDC153]MEC3951504.1 NAD(P)-binding domain-containing protein [Nocardia sp. CDC153]
MRIGIPSVGFASQTQGVDMRIGIIGAGQMARALGGGWAAAGHEIVIGARTSARAGEAAAAIGAGARAVSLAEAARFGDVTLLAVPVSALAEVLEAAADGPARSEQESGGTVFAGRTLIDCTNAFAPDEGGFTLSEPAVAERIAATVPDARVVKAFNLLAAEVWAGSAREFDGRTLAVPLCGDDAAAVDLVAALAQDLKLHPVRAGGLRQARYLEATSAFVVGLWFAGNDARAMFPPLEAAFAVPDAE